MHYVIIRDDDTNALTPVACLEKLYRPFLNRGLPVNLATIPAVSTGTRRLDGAPEGFLVFKNGETREQVSIGENQDLVRYLKANQQFHIVQHGLHHDLLEFDTRSVAEVERRLEEGTRLLSEAGFSLPETFVAPYDKLSRQSLRAVSYRFPILSTGWFELRRLPVAWWPRYAIKKWRGSSHWKVDRTILLSHPGCLLSCYRDYERAPEEIRRQIASHRVVVLVTHWWEYFRNGQADERFVAVLHEVADLLAKARDVKVIKFRDLLEEPVLLN